MRFSRVPRFTRTQRYLSRLERLDPRNILERYGRAGVQALSAATPMDTGETASKWSYKIEGDRNRYRLVWTNSELAGRVPLVIIIQYGHATKSGYFLSGIDFINPALRPVYHDLKQALQREVF